VTSEETIVRWLTDQLARELHLEPAEIDPRRPISVYGLDSLTAAGLAADLEDAFGLRLGEDAFRDALTIQDVARLASGAVASRPPSPAVPRPVAIDRGTGDYSSWTRSQRTVLRVARVVARSLARIEVTGMEHAAVSGPIILASNHLHILDALWLSTVVPRRAVFLAAEEFRSRPVVGWLLRLGETIFVARGKGDRQAIDRAVAVLRSGGCVAIAPEGRLSRTGGLIKGQVGVAVLAAESQAPIVPVAMHGQEHAGRMWLRGRRPLVHVRFGEPLAPPSASARTARHLELYADGVMKTLARMLPPAYRGQYPDPD